MSDDSLQCKGRTNKGTRCKRKAADGYCRSHKDQDPASEIKDSLSDQQRLFVETYLANGLNGRQAAITAGYSPEAHGYYKLLQRPKIKKIVEQRLEEHAMTANETLARLTEWGRGTIDHFIDEHGKIDLESPQAKAHRHLIKKIKLDKYNQPGEIELYNPKDAVKSLAKIHGLVTDRVEHSGSVEHVEKPAYDYSVLTDDELDALEKITQKLEATSSDDDQD